jgi:hypothetical protein
MQRNVQTLPRMNRRQYKRLAHVARKLGLPSPKKTTPQSNTKPAETKKPRRLVSIPRIVKWAALILGVVVAAFELWPDVSVEPYASRDQHSPFAELFSVENTNRYSIYEVQPQCDMDRVTTKGIVISGLSVANADERVPVLAPKAKTTATCNFLQAPSYGELLIAIRVAYKVIPGIVRCKVVRFSGVSAVDAYVWTYRGAGTCTIN